jgi:tRNA pseudouridine38-40 synthase
MHRYCIELSYLGTDFAGWQSQINAIGVQTLIEKALSQLLKEPILIVGSSRTDAGVHALQQFAHFDTSVTFDIADFCYRMNQMLPFSICIKNIAVVKPNFHSRFDAISRSYEYRITRKKDPFLIGQAYFFSTYLDIDLMNEACKILFEHTDYQAFSKVHTDVTTFHCTIMRAECIVTNDLLVFHIKANRFLRGMVRAIVGTLIDVGLNKLSLEDFEQIILLKNRKNAGASVPAKGLFLTEVNY